MTLVNSRTIQGRCPVCSGEHTKCGPPSDSVPIEQNMEEVAAVGGPLKRYTVVSPSGVETTMKLNETDARRHGVFEEHQPDAAPAPAEQEAPAAKKRAAPRNKARTETADKDGGTGGGD